MRTAPGTSHARRVLVVDDNQDAADSLAMLLGTRGDEVRIAYDGSQALEVERDF
jgi:CheY-like chemotaxis protein